MRLASIPPLFPENPFATLLYRELGGLGVEYLGSCSLRPRWLWGRRSEVEALHLHWPEHVFVRPGRLATAARAAALSASLAFARFLGYRVLWTVHNLEPHDNVHPWLTRVGFLGPAWLASHVFVHDAGTVAALARRTGRRRRVVVAPFGNYLDWYPEPPERLEARRRLGLGEKDFVYLHLGLMRPYKGVSDLLSAFTRVGRPDDRLLLAGVFRDHDLWREATEAAAADPRIHVVDRRLADEELPVFFGAANVTVLPFRRATTSSSAILALGFGVPVVATAVGNVSDLITSACGVVVPVRDPEALAQALDQAHSLGPEAERAARARAAQFTWQRAAQIIAQALEVPAQAPRQDRHAEPPTTSFDCGRAPTIPSGRSSPRASTAPSADLASPKVPANSRDPVIVLAAGGYRSGSTLQYNLIGEYVERLNVGRRIGIIRAPAVAALRDNWSIVESLGIAVGKTHEAPSSHLDPSPSRRAWREPVQSVVFSAKASAPQDSPWRELFHSDRLIALYTVRDWRDVAASMCRKFCLNIGDLFESEHWLTNIDSLNGWIEMQPLIQRYEDLTGSSLDALRQLVRRIGIDFVPEVAEEAVATSSIEAHSVVADELRPGAYDKRTLVHWNHIDSPAGGSWRSWPEEDQELLRQSVGGLMKRFGYQW